MAIIDDDTRPKLNASKKVTRPRKKSSNPETKRYFIKTSEENISDGSSLPVLSKLIGIPEDKLKKSMENGQPLIK